MKRFMTVHSLLNKFLNYDNTISLPAICKHTTCWTMYQTFMITLLHLFIELVQLTISPSLETVYETLVIWLSVDVVAHKKNITSKYLTSTIELARTHARSSNKCKNYWFHASSRNLSDNSKTHLGTPV